ncbi:MAG: translation initiation factor [Bacteroidetes bacterium]|nr:translation initiation factor [Bacteroidota bacterium]
MDNDWKKRLGVVYSTNQEFKYEGEENAQRETLPPGQQKLYVSLDKKNRKGKAVTLVEGFTGSEEELKSLGKELKSKCGSGGTAKKGEIIIQGDFRDRVATMLKDKGYGVKRKGE